MDHVKTRKNPIITTDCLTFRSIIVKTHAYYGLVKGVSAKNSIHYRIQYMCVKKNALIYSQ